MTGVSISNNLSDMFVGRCLRIGAPWDMAHELGVRACVVCVHSASVGPTLSSRGGLTEHVKRVHQKLARYKCQHCYITGSVSHIMKT